MPDPTPEHLASLARVLDPANIKSRGYLAITPHEAAKALYAAVRTDRAVQDAVLAALVEGGALHCCCAWCCTGSPREQRGQGHAGCPS
jgi:hypothetical protein